MRKYWMAALAVMVTGCANVGSPSPINGAAEWARLHINEVCITYEQFGKGYLIPANMTLPEGAVIRPISYCNPAE